MTTHPSLISREMRFFWFGVFVGATATSYMVDYLFGAIAGFMLCIACWLYLIDDYKPVQFYRCVLATAVVELMMGVAMGNYGAVLLALVQAVYIIRKLVLKSRNTSRSNETSG